MLLLLALAATSTAAAASVELLPPLPPPLPTAPPALASVVTAPPAPPDAPGRTTAQLATLVGSLSVVAAGIAFAAWAAVEANDRSHTFLCVETCAAATWTRMFDRPDDGDLSRPLAGTGPAILPFGLSLIGAGTTTALGAELFEDDGALPWISIVSGLVLGATMYSVFEAVEQPLVQSFDPRTPAEP